MKRKTVLLLSSFLAASLLVGGAFAAFLVTDNADSKVIDITPNHGEAPTPVVLEWGEGTTEDVLSVDDILPGHTYKVSTVYLKSSVAYTGDLSLTLADTSVNKLNTQYYLINYLKIYLYSGADGDIGEASLPTSGYLASTTLGDTTLTYKSATGSPEGNPYSVYIYFDTSCYSIYTAIQDDAASLTIDWNESSGVTPVEELYNNVYFATDWDDCYLYSWDDHGGSNNEYPGILMDKLGKNSYQQYIYKGSLDVNSVGFKFSCGDSTSDILTADYMDAGLATKSLLFWKDGDTVGYKELEDSDIVTYEGNYGTNPGPILHAWGWTTQKVKDNLSTIANAGYKAVQLSPLQSNDVNENTVWSLLYQPKGLSVATGSNNKYSPIGTKASLTELTAAADKLGIDIIVDVIVNHLSGGNKDTFHSMVHTLEKKIYEDNLKHNVGIIDWKSNPGVREIVRGNLGDYPDLQTENEDVQDRVIDMLEEYIDCGVKGFRFDAAKHVETPDDGDYASNFWPRVIRTINAYGVSKYGKTPYSYGEVLGTEAGRSYGSYTNYIDITDNVKCNDVKFGLTGAYEKNISDAGSSSMFIGDKKHAVLFGETHDNYSDYGSDSGALDQRVANMAYAINAARADATPLYFARPSGEDNHYKTTKCVITDVSTSYFSPEITAVNRLHNEFVGGSEYLNVLTTEGIITNTRHIGNKYGVLICDPSYRSSSDVYIAGGIASGTYINLVNGEQVTINNSNAHVNFVNGIAVLVNATQSDPSVAPTSGFAIKLTRNEEVTYHPGTFKGVNDDGKSVYEINNLALQVNDKFCIYDGLNGASFNDADLNTDGLSSNFASNADYVKVNIAGTYTIQIQLQFENNSYLIYQ